MIRRLAIAVLLLAGAAVARAQSPHIIRLDDAGMGKGPQLLAEALSRPYAVIPPGASEAVIRRDTTYSQTVIILGRNAAVEGTVRGDVIVVGGDLYLRPRANISGRAMAIGGGVYESTLATVAGGVLPFRDFTYDFTEIPGGFALRYRSFGDRPAKVISLPGLYGFRVPNYDRSNGLSASFGPRIGVPNTQILIEPVVTYRSQLGQIDPMLTAGTRLNSRTAIRLSYGRATISNEAWIRPDISNSAASIWSGDDARNYFRATRFEGVLARVWSTDLSSLEPTIGIRAEVDRSVRPDSQVQGGPWSFRGRNDTDDMLRPNPAIDHGAITSGLLGVAGAWLGDVVAGRATIDGELGFFDPSNPVVSAVQTFAQATFDGTITFPTFGLQSIRFDAHFVVTGGDPTPRQRYAYVGGPGSISTLDMLARGGDELVYIDGRYNIPITKIVLPLIGSPIVTLREVLAGADVRRFPNLAQATGVRLWASVAHVEFLFDPVTHRTHWGFGVSLPR